MIKNDTREIPNKGFTHGGTFHADDVFSAALLKLLNSDIKIERGFKVPENYDGIVFDIGLGEFDHHQSNNEIRENKIPYASFGKLWQAFGNRLVSEKSVESIDKFFIQGLDESDNTGCYNALAIAISSYNPTWNSKENPTLKFEDAVEFATKILSNIIEREKSKELAQEIVEEAIDKAADKNIIILPYYVPAVETLIPTDAKFFIFPSNRGGYNIQVVPQEIGDQTAKIDFPESWAGKNELDKISNIKTLTFCHNARFLCATDTLEDAIKVAVTALDYNDRYDEKEYKSKVFNIGKKRLDWMKENEEIQQQR